MIAKKSPLFKGFSAGEYVEKMQLFHRLLAAGGPVVHKMLWLPCPSAHKAIAEGGQFPSF